MDYRDRKAKTHRGRVHLEQYKPKIIEGPRGIMVTRGSKTSDQVSRFLEIFNVLFKSRTQKLNSRYDTRPFEDAGLMLHLSDKHQCPLFLFGQSSKKHPSRIVIGRVFEREILDLLQLDILSFSGELAALNRIPTHQRPVFVAIGDRFETDEKFMRVRNLFHDLVRSDCAEKVHLIDSLHLVVVLTCLEDGTLVLKICEAKNKKLTDLELKIEMKLTESKLAEKEAFKIACRKPKENKKPKGLEKNTLGEQIGRVRVRQQDLKTLKLKKIKKLKNEKRSDKRDAMDGDDF